MIKHSFENIEQFAAFLDGNLSQNEMQHLSHIVDQNDMLHQLLGASHVVDDAIAGFTDSDLQLPEEITGSDFELPEIEEIDDSTLIGASIPDNDHFHMDILSNHPFDDSHSSHHLKPFHELYTNGEIIEEFMGEPTEDSSNNGLPLFDETIGNAGIDSHATPLDALEDNTDFNLGD